MNDNFVFTQTKETIMTMEKTTTITTEKLENVDLLGKRHLKAYQQTTYVSLNDNSCSNFGRAA